MRIRRSMAAGAMLVAAIACGEPGDPERGDPFDGAIDPTRAEGLSAAGEGAHDTEPAAGSDESGTESDGTSGADTSSGSAGTFSPLDDGGGSGGAAPQPGDGWWSPCLYASDCDPGLACLGTDRMTDGVCTSQCSPYGNAQSCAPSPGGTAEPTCLTVAGQSVCALDCSSGRSCPAGMGCLADTDDLGPIAICM